ncbi:hypothetical protein MRX96_046027 [Rhipicephalus microplus]
MEAMRVINAPKRPRVPGPEQINKKLCRLSDNPELIVYGETAEGRRWHHEWLTENASTAEDAILGVLKFIANRCNDSLETLLTDKADTPLTPCIQRATDGTLVLHADNQRLPTPRRRAFSTTDSNDWTTTNPANTAAATAEDFPNHTNLADKTNAI